MGKSARKVALGWSVLGAVEVLRCGRWPAVTVPRGREYVSGDLAASCLDKAMRGDSCGRRQGIRTSD